MTPLHHQRPLASTVRFLAGNPELLTDDMTSLIASTDHSNEPSAYHDLKKPLDDAKVKDGYRRRCPAVAGVVMKPSVGAQLVPGGDAEHDTRGRVCSPELLSRLPKSIPLRSSCRKAASGNSQTLRWITAVLGTGLWHYISNLLYLQRRKKKTD